MSLSQNPFTLKTLELLGEPLSHKLTTPIPEAEEKEATPPALSYRQRKPLLSITRSQTRQLIAQTQWTKERVAHHSKSRKKSDQLLRMLDEVIYILQTAHNEETSDRLTRTLRQKWMEIIREAAKERPFAAENNAKTTYAKTTSYQVILAKLSGSLWPQIINLNVDFIDKSTSTPSESIQKKITENKQLYPGDYDLIAMKNMISTQALRHNKPITTGSAVLYQITDPYNPELHTIIDQLTKETKILLQKADKKIKPIIQNIQALLQESKPNKEILFNRWTEALAKTFPHENHHQFLTQYAGSSWVRLFNNASINDMRHQTLSHYPEKTCFWIKIPYTGQGDADHQPCHGFRDPSRPLLSNIRSIAAIFFITKLMQKHLTLTLELKNDLNKENNESLAASTYAAQGLPLHKQTERQKKISQLHNIDLSIQKISNCRTKQDQDQALAKQEDSFAKTLIEQMTAHKSEHPLFDQLINILARISRQNTTPHAHRDDSTLTPGELSANTQRLISHSNDDTQTINEFKKHITRIKPLIDLKGFHLDDDPVNRPMNIDATSLSPHKGTSLRLHLLNNSDMNIADDNSTRRIMQLTNLLRELHEHQIIHPDISLENLLVNENDTLTLCDDEGMSVVTAMTTEDQDIYDEVNNLLQNSLNQSATCSRTDQTTRNEQHTTHSGHTCSSYLYNYCTLFRWLCYSYMTIRDNLFWNPLNQRSAPSIFTKTSALKVSDEETREAVKTYTVA